MFFGISSSPLQTLSRPFPSQLPLERGPLSVVSLSACPQDRGLSVRLGVLTKINKCSLNFPVVVVIVVVVHELLTVVRHVDFSFKHSN